MNYYSLNKKAPTCSFKEAVINGIAPDKGLYYPEHMTPLPESFFKTIEDLTYNEIAFTVLKPFVGLDISVEDLKTIISETLSFDFPVVFLSENISTLELFHGPTMAFKDLGARFMAKCLQHFTGKTVVTILVATSGDTGGAVAHGFLGVEGVKVVILYPSGKVSDIQEKQLTTLGQNITALEVDGTFDDCQDMVKTAFLDADIKMKRKLSSANSINIARWLPQMLYYFFAYKQVKHLNKNIAFSVPSGNFGNICAGLMTQHLGLPVSKFIAANNSNNVVTEYLNTKTYQIKPTIATMSNAMDVSNPSNFIRIETLFKTNFEVLKTHLDSFSFTDEETKEALKELKQQFNYIADPHGAVGYLGAKSYLKKQPEAHCIFLETAHPAKFSNSVEPVLNTTIEMPQQLKEVMYKVKTSIKISSYAELKSFLLK